MFAHGINNVWKRSFKMNFWDTFYKEIIVFGLSLLPISEIRGSVIYGLTALGKDLSTQIFVYIISVIGNFLPVPFILLLFRPLLKYLKKFKAFKRFTDWLENRTLEKASRLAKISAGALYVFVAIPFPTTGAWTGSMIAALLNIRLRYALPAILAGIMTSGLIVALLMNGVLSFGALDAIFLK